MTEITRKLQIVRAAMASSCLTAVRLRGVDWFAWATAGGSNVVLLAAETGVAEILVTHGAAMILTNSIEAERLRADVARDELEIWTAPWQEPQRREAFVRDIVGSGVLASDRPVANESSLPTDLIRAKRRLLPEEQERYRTLSAHAALALTATLKSARPELTEHELTGMAARELWSRGLEPILVMAAGASRVGRWRHPVSTDQAIGERAMVVACARRHGLVANLTRFVYFRQPTLPERRLAHDVAVVEARAFELSRPGSALSDVYRGIAAAYETLGYADEVTKHHQGGTSGYRSREIIASPDRDESIELGTPLAWNPSLPGAKIEDTVLVGEGGLETLTVDPAWPVVSVGGRLRPDLLVRP